MTTDHPITPPPELVQQWAQYKGFVSPEALWRFIATEAARWGADQELEACVEWIAGQDWTWTSAQLRAARRPKPPSLKEQALATLEAMEKLWESCGDNPTDIIRCALEALPDD